jgi:hypothetical protein
MERLKEQLEKLISELGDAHAIYEQIGNLISVYPFNEYEYMISTLLGRGQLTLDDYYALRDEYVERNLYLYIFEISAPVGEGQLHLRYDNIDEFNRYEVTGRDLLQAIRNAHQRQHLP